MALVFFLFLIVGFGRLLFNLMIYAAGSDLHSHILLVPVISAYLIYLRRDQLRLQSRPAIALGAISFAIGCLALAIGWHVSPVSWPESYNDYLAVMTLAFLCFAAAGGFVLLGGEQMRSFAFPFLFLIFLIPLPDGIVWYLETDSKLASAEAAALFFNLTGTPVLRDGTIFQLPGIVIEVARECSGIRSSWVLFITSLLASHLFLRSPWRRAFLVGFVIPLGIVRNGFRILVIGLLCVHIGPQMIDSVIHHRGGPLFFGLSLIPLFLLLWWLRRGESVPSS